MGVRGRASGAELAVIPGRTAIAAPAPAHLDTDEAAVWHRLMATERSGHFARAAMRDLLTSYCRTTVRAERFAAELDAAGDLETRLKLARAIDQAVARQVQLAMKMRLTPASRERAVGGGAEPTGVNPLDHDIDQL